jgi:GT2 family glycosyltransferase
MQMKLSIIIVAINPASHLEGLLKTIKANTHGEYDITALTYSGNEKLCSFIKSCGDITTRIFSKTDSHTAMIDAGVLESQGEEICFLTDDTLVSKDWNLKLSRGLADKKLASCIGPMTATSKSMQQIHRMIHCQEVVGPDDINIVQEELAEITVAKTALAKITGFCFYTTRKLWEKIGALDPELTYEGAITDWILRGLKHDLCPYIETAVYVHNFNKRLAAAERAYWRVDRPHLIKQHGEKLFNFLEIELYDKLMKLSGRI